MGCLDLQFHSSKMAKAMKAMKAMAAMKAMGAMKKKPISAKLARRHVFAGKIDKTKTGLKASDLKLSKTGKVVSKKRSVRAKAAYASCLEGSQSSECQGFRCYQEGHSTLQEGQGVLPVSGSSGSLRHQLQTWGFLRLSSAGASFSKVFGIHIDEGCK